jgi:hypothetical protein
MSPKTKKRNEQYQANKQAKVGEEIICPVCGKHFTKKQYSQAFCCGECKDRFWNRKGDRHRPGYFEQYDQEHPERLERAAVWGGKDFVPLTRADADEWLALQEYNSDPAFRRYVDEGRMMDGGWDEHGCAITLAQELENFHGDYYD